MVKVILVALAAVVLGVPIGWITAMLFTPVLWRLEPVLNMELAGHSGPSDWVMLTIMGIVVVVLFLLLHRIIVSGRHSE